MIVKQDLRPLHSSISFNWLVKAEASDMQMTNVQLISYCDVFKSPFLMVEVGLGLVGFQIKLNCKWSSHYPSASNFVLGIVSNVHTWRQKRGHENIVEYFESIPKPNSRGQHKDLIFSKHGLNGDATTKTTSILRCFNRRIWRQATRPHWNNWRGMWPMHMF